MAKVQRIAKAIMKENKVEALIIPSIKTYNEAKLIQQVALAQEKTD